MKIGFLPLYIKLYDEVAPQYHEEMQNYADRIASLFQKRGFEVVSVPLCRVKAEFQAAAERFAEEQVQAVITLHTAYSPSLESADILAKIPVPLVILDTTPHYEFDFDQVDRLMYNHGIHGVQDLSNLLIRRKKNFHIEAGHVEHSDVIDRIVRYLKAAEAAGTMKHARVGSVGGSFDGMGDFCFDRKDLPVDVISYQPQQIREEEVDRERDRNRDLFVHGKYSPEVYRTTLRECLKIRKWVETEKLDAFTICFLGINRPEWDCVPFLEASKAMAAGTGYAGEGDVLTAAYCASVMKMFPQSTFSEMFCPDWKGNRIFVSHMGEINIALTEKKPLLEETDYVFSHTGNMVKASGCLKPGKAILSNLAPGPDGKFVLTGASIVLSAPGTPSTNANTGWFSPEKKDIASFLTEYSKRGGTHHLVISYDAEMDLLKKFADLMNWEFREI